MKIINALILSCLISTSCFCFAQNGKKGYQIVGDVKNIPSNWVYLKLMKRDQKNKLYWPTIDSACVLNGKFSLHRDTILADPGWASSISYKDSTSKKQTQLYFRSPYLKNGKASSHGSFILENADIFIDGDLRNNKGVSIKGSKETDFSMQYGLIYPPSIYIINKKIDSLKTISATEKLALAEAERTEMLKDFKKTFKQIIADNSNVWMALLNTYEYADYFSLAELAEMAAIFNKELMKGPTGQKLSTYIAQSKILLTDQIFPAFSYVDATKKKFNLNDVKGKKGTLVVFWASWCGPCRAEIPELKTFYAEYKNKGINLLSISIDHDIADWKKALNREQMPWVNLSNLPGDYKEITSKYNIKAIPAMFLLDGNNKLVLVNPNDFKLVKEKVSDIVKGD